MTRIRKVAVFAAAAAFTAAAVAGAVHKPNVVYDMHHKSPNVVYDMSHRAAKPSVVYDM